MSADPSDFPAASTLVLGVLVTAGPGAAWWLFQRWVKQKDEAEAQARIAEEARRREEAQRSADFMAEVKADLKRLLEGQANTATSLRMLEGTVSNHEGRLAHLDKRQDAQAAAHLAAIESLRAEFAKRGKR